MNARTAIPKAAAVAVALCTMAASLAASTSASADDDADRIKRGKYLVSVGACNDCHTPMKMGTNGPERDGARLLSGHPEAVAVNEPAVLAGPDWQVAISGTMTAYSGAWGVRFGANLTPDPDTGLGRWTLRNFTDTIRNGRHLGRGRPLLPPMPVEMYRDMTDEDLASIFAYLKSVPAVRNRVPQPLAPSPVRTARAMPASP
jgi:hypothetical protein